jgi:hypothetical protein
MATNSNDAPGEYVHTIDELRAEAKRLHEQTQWIENETLRLQVESQRLGQTSESLAKERETMDRRTEQEERTARLEKLVESLLLGQQPSQTPHPLPTITIANPTPPPNDAAQTEYILSGERRRQMKSPEPFGGERGTLQRFLDQLELHFDSQDPLFATDDGKIRWSISFMSGKVTDWTGPLLKAKRKNPLSPPAELASWDAFEQALRDMYGVTDEARQAEARLHRLTQTGSASEYSSKFMQLRMLLSDWSEKPLISIYERGLKTSVQRALLPLGPRPTTLAQMMRNAVNVDNLDFQFRQDQRSVHTPQTDPDTMDLSAIEVRTQRTKGPKGQLTPDERKRRSNNNLCYRCASPTHRASDCTVTKTGDSPKN